MRPGRKTPWKYIGGVNDWGELSVDSARGIAFVSTGSGDLRFLRRGPRR